MPHALVCLLIGKADATCSRLFAHRERGKLMPRALVCFAHMGKKTTPVWPILEPVLIEGGSVTAENYIKSKTDGGPYLRPISATPPPPHLHK